MDNIYCALVEVNYTDSDTLLESSIKCARLYYKTECHNVNAQKI